MIPAGIEPATFRYVAQYLNHCATAVFMLYTYLIDGRSPRRWLTKSRNMLDILCFEFEIYIYILILCI